MKALLIISSLFLALFYGTANADFLKAEKGFYTEIIGDGFEDGFSFETSFYSADKSAKLKVEIPTADNSSDCNLKIAKIKDTKKVGANLYQLFYGAAIWTSVNADTGGCLVFAKNDSNETLKIINYSYTTD